MIPWGLWFLARGRWGALDAINFKNYYYTLSLGSFPVSFSMGLYFIFRIITLNFAEEINAISINANTNSHGAT